MEITCPKCGAKIDLTKTSVCCVYCGWWMNDSFNTSTAGLGTWNLSDRRDTCVNFYCIACTSI